MCLRIILKLTFPSHCLSGACMDPTPREPCSVIGVEPIADSVAGFDTGFGFRFSDFGFYNVQVFGWDNTGLGSGSNVERVAHISFAFFAPEGLHQLPLPQNSFRNFSFHPLLLGPLELLHCVRLLENVVAVQLPPHSRLQPKNLTGKKGESET